MRLKVEVEWQGEPWKRRSQVRRLAVVDAVFGVAVASLYAIKLAFPDMEPEVVVINPRDKLNTTLILVFLLAANLIQTFHASFLCYSVTRDEGRSPVSCHRAAKTWFDFTEFSFVFMVIKCVATVGYLVKVAAYPWVVILTAITLPEVIFKLVSLYIVYEFMKDLRRSLKYLPKFYFIPVGTSHMDSTQKIALGDENCNTQFNV